MQNMLRPIVEAAAIASSATATNCSPDLVIRSDGATPRADRRRARADAAPPIPTPPTARTRIYRYDRAGLMLALKSAGAGRGR